MGTKLSSKAERVGLPATRFTDDSVEGPGLALKDRQRVLLVPHNEAKPPWRYSVPEVAKVFTFCTSVKMWRLFCNSARNNVFVVNM